MLSQISSETFILDGDSSVHISTVTIDSTIGNSTIFTYSWSYGEYPPNVVLQPPADFCETIIAPGNSSCADITTDKVYQTLTIKIYGTAMVLIVSPENDLFRNVKHIYLQAGIWTSDISVSTSSNQIISVFVTSKAAQVDVEPITAEATLEWRNDIPIVYAKV